VRLSDGTRVRRSILELERLTRVDSLTTLAADLALSLRAQVAWREGHGSDALHLLERTRMRMPWDWAWEDFSSEGYERYLRAELLHAAGRDQEALGWYGSLGELLAGEFPFVAPAEFRQGEIYERLGERAKAAASYERFVSLWKDCDPELASWRDRGRLALARVQGRTATTDTGVH
jgi:tetratricopeptide (TPR) repeat protein